MNLHQLLKVAAETPEKEQKTFLGNALDVVRDYPKAWFESVLPAFQAGDLNSTRNLGDVYFDMYHGKDKVDELAANKALNERVKNIKSRNAADRAKRNKMMQDYAWDRYGRRYYEEKAHSQDYKNDADAAKASLFGAPEGQNMSPASGSAAYEKWNKSIPRPQQQAPEAPKQAPSLARNTHREDADKAYKELFGSSKEENMSRADGENRKQTPRKRGGTAKTIFAGAKKARPQMEVSSVSDHPEKPSIAMKDVPARENALRAARSGGYGLTGEKDYASRLQDHVGNMVAELSAPKETRYAGSSIPTGSRKLQKERP